MRLLGEVRSPRAVGGLRVVVLRMFVRRAVVCTQENVNSRANENIGRQTRRTGIMPPYTCSLRPVEVAMPGWLGERLRLSQLASQPAANHRLLHHHHHNWQFRGRHAERAHESRDPLLTRSRTRLHRKTSRHATALVVRLHAHETTHLTTRVV
jgi:hypothetical protein